MRKITAIMTALAVGGSTAIGGCATGGEAAPTITVTVQATPTPTEKIAEERFWEWASPHFIGFESAKVIRAGHSVCNVLASGGTYQGVIKVVAGSDLDLEQGAALISGATSILCPEYKGIGGAGVSESTPTPTQQSRDDQFWARVKGDFFGHEAPNVVRMCHKVCATLDAGKPYRSVINAMTEPGVSMEEFVKLVAGAVTILCPEYRGIGPRIIDAVKGKA